jgi:hypothetical protein
MTQAQLDRAVAQATGETLYTIRCLGFGLTAYARRALEPEDLTLVLDCPFCGRAVAYPGLGGDGSLPVAACLRCDVDFAFQPNEVYVASLARSL